MTFGSKNTLAGRATILVFAIVFGIVVCLGTLPSALIGQFHFGDLSVRTIIFAILGIALCAFLGSIFLEKAENRQHQIDRDLLETFLRHVPDNVFFKDRESRYLRMSQRLAQHLGLADPDQAIHKTEAEIFRSPHAEQSVRDDEEILRTGKPLIGKEEKVTWPDGREAWVVTTKVAMRDRDGEIIGTMGITHDITDRKQAESKILHMALHDSLTGLPNRTSFESQLSQSIAQSGKGSVALLLLGIDRFKSINDAHGHYFGDRLLEAIANRLKGCLKEADTIARLSGDDFAVALPECSGKAEAERVAQQLLEAIGKPFQVEGLEVQLSASVGISLYPQNGESPAVLLRAADAAMYEAKRQGRGACSFYTPTISESTKRQKKLEADLVQAHERDEFVLYYQPFVSAHTGRITGVEALLRWRHPKQGLILPEQFITELGNLGLMNDVGRWVLKNACYQAVDWQRLGLQPVRIAVNLSSQQLRRYNIVETVDAVLRELPFDPTLLDLELADDRSVGDSEQTLNIMGRLKQLGVNLSLDDFGSGWSSLASLRRYPVDRLKIDRSFVRDMETQPGAEAVVKSILSLGRSLGIACTAKGVETRQQRDSLRRQGCEEMQGFLYSRAVPALEITSMLRYGKFDI